MADPSSTKIERRIKEQRIKVKDVRRRIAKSKEKIVKLEAEETHVIRDLEHLNLQLNRLRVQRRELSAEIAQLESKTETLKDNRQILVHRIKKLEAYAVRRIVAFYKLCSLGVASVLFSTDSIFDLWQRRRALEYILQHDANQWDKLQNQKQELERLSRTLRTYRLDRDRLLAKSKEAALQIAEKKAKRSNLLASIRTDKDLLVNSVAALRRSADALNETIASLRRKITHYPPPNRVRPGAFLARKGSLPRPVPGKVAGAFGPYLDETRHSIEGFRSGIKIKADIGTPIQAIHNGEVIYADWFKGYGNMIIIDHGDRYYTLYAQLESSSKKEGEPVESGEPIGTVGDTGTLSGPGLYFEIRHRGKPLDPMAWFKK